MFDTDFKRGDLVFCPIYGLGTVINPEFYPDGDLKGFHCKFANGLFMTTANLQPWNSNEFTSVIKGFSDDLLVETIKAGDAYNLPISQRIKGDTDALDNIMPFSGVNNDIVSKFLVLGMLLREAVSRGIKVPT